MSVSTADDGEGKRGNRAAKHAEGVDIAELEKRVHLAELHAREAEAEVRYLEAAAKRKALKGARKTGGRDATKENRERRRKGRSGEDDD